MINDVEILAPAGSREQLVAAVRTGANAVYLGVGTFNARRNAENFSVADLKDVTEYCHVRGVKVYLALNTLVKDTEIADAYELIKSACTFGVDAFIIQDLGLVSLVKELAPEMPLHASTQMAVHTPEGFKFLENLGFVRAVLPRELSFSEIKEIKESTNMELEMFIHGAHCMCVSGQCYLSSMLGGRSGNRGLCAQPCRLPFSAPGGTGYDLSLKDLSLIEHLPKLKKLGIVSFKIEGRMKRPEYVAAAVSACKMALDTDNQFKDHCKAEELYSDLKAVFSRSGFTDGYFKNELGRNMFGTRVKDDVTSAEPVLKRLSKLYEKEQAIIPISVSLTAQIGKPLMASASTGKTRVFVTSDYKVQKAKTHATEVSSIRAQLKKTGGTPFEVKMTDIDIDENINIPLSEINNIRRLVLLELEKKLTMNYKKSCGEINEWGRFSVTGDGSQQLGTVLNNWGRFSATENRPPWQRTVPLGGEPSPLAENRPQKILSFLNDGQVLSALEFLENGSLGKEQYEFLIMPDISEGVVAKIKKHGVPFGVSVPRALYGFKGNTVKAIKELKKKGASFLYVGTIDGLAISERIDLPVVLGPTFNIFNSYSLDLIHTEIKAAIVSAELTMDEAINISSRYAKGICAYGRVPLMLTRNCPIKNGQSCKSCGGKSFLTDRKGIKFPIICANGASELLNSRPIILSDKEKDLRKFDYELLLFTVEAAEKVSDVLMDYETQREPTGEFTRGLYYRGVE
ncbi:MAG: U32 family peptidase [Oscillospiraceae bacterium]|nr:U32 family peptidase [Oscillospiraceae bacterium]